MKKLATFLTIVALTGCSVELNGDNDSKPVYGGPNTSSLPSLNSAPTKCSACTDQPKHCGCNGMSPCSEKSSCGKTCTPESCSCHEIQ